MPVPGHISLRLLRAGFLFPVWISLWAGSTNVWAQSKPEGPSAETWFRLGKMLASQGKTEQAYEAYLSAWNLNRRSPEVACNLGDIEVELGKIRDAAEHLSFCSSHFPVTGTPKQRKALQARFERVRDKVGSITIELEPEHSSISVDGTVVGETPLEDSIFVDPGAHTIKMERDGYLPAEQMVELARGQQITISLSLKPKPIENGPVLVLSAAPSFAPWWPIFLTGGLTLTGIGLGVGAHLESNSKQNEANLLWVELARKNGRSACNLSENKDNCNALESSSEQASLFYGFSIGGFVGAGVAAAATGFFLYRALSAPATPKSDVAMTIEWYPNGGAGALIRGVF